MILKGWRVQEVHKMRYLRRTGRNPSATMYAVLGVKYSLAVGILGNALISLNTDKILQRCNHISV